MSYFVRCRHCDAEFPQKPKNNPKPEAPCPNCSEDGWAIDLYRNEYIFNKGGKTKILKLCYFEYQDQIGEILDDGWSEERVGGFPASVVRNKGRKVRGDLGDRLKAIDKAYGSKSNIRDSVDLPVHA